MPRCRSRCVPYDAEKTLQSKWSGEVVSVSLELSLEMLSGRRPTRHTIYFKESSKLPKLTMTLGAGLVEPVSRMPN